MRGGRRNAADCGVNGAVGANVCPGPCLAAAMRPAPSGSVTMVVAEQTAKPLSALDLAFAATDVSNRFDDLVRQGLVIALAVITRKILTNGVLQRALAEKEHPQKTLFLDTSHESFDVRRQIG